MYIWSNSNKKSEFGTGICIPCSLIYNCQSRIKTFADATEKAIGKKIAFLYNGDVICAPSPNARLESGHFAISLSPEYNNNNDIHKIYWDLQKELLQH